MGQGIGALNVSVNAETSKATSNINSFRSELHKLPNSVGQASGGLNGLGSLLGGVEGGASGAVAGLGAIGIAIAGAAAAAGAAYAAFQFMKPAIEDLGNLNDAAGKIGIATEALGGLHFAAEDVGVGAEAFDKSMVKMMRSVAEVSGGSGAAKDAFDALGLSAEKMISLAPEEQFRMIAEGMERIPSAAEKLDVAMDIFGKSGADMVNVLGMGRAELDAAQKEAERFGTALGGEAVAAVDAVGDAMGNVGKAANGLRNEMAVIAAPMLEGAANLMTESLIFLRDGLDDIAYHLGWIDDLSAKNDEQALAAERAATAAKAQADAEHKVTKAYEDQLTKLREKLAMEKDPSTAQYNKDVAEFGVGRAGDLNHIRDQIYGVQMRKEKEKAEAQEAERQKKDEERKKEQKDREAERRHQANLKRDAEILRDLKERAANFGKSQLEMDRAKAMAELDDPKQKQEAEGYFKSLEQLEKNKKDLEQLRENRDTIAGRGANNILDARTAEGWAALKGGGNEQLKRLDKQIALLETISRQQGDGGGVDEDPFDF